ncbi:MAG: alpha/beta hydrolase [Actinomycetota bacterium]
MVKRVTANGVDFAYLEKGPSDGPLVLCLHGFPDHAPTFEPLLDALGDAGFHAVAPWLRGYSPTGPAPDGKYHTQSLALDALELTDALAPSGDAYLVGSDWGAGAATLAVAHRPERFRKLVTMAVPPPGVIDGKFLGSPEQLKRSWYIWFFGTPLADIAVPMNDYAFIDKIWADWSPGYAVPESFMRALKDSYAVDGAQAAIGYYRDSMHARSAPSEEAAAVTGGAITIPHLYFHGADDGCLGAELIDDDLVRKVLSPDGEYVLVANAGHFLHLEQPDEVNAKIVSFLKA